MSARRHPIAERPSDGTARWAADAELHARVLQDMVARPHAYADIPHGSTLILVPDDDQAQAEWAIRQGAAAARRGASVYLRRTVVADLPEIIRAPGDDPVGTRRIDYAPDGSVQQVMVKGQDGDWREVESTPDDAAGLPPVRRARSG